MKKKIYEKPTCKVYEFTAKTKLLVGSDNTEKWGRIPTIPGMSEDEKQLA
jgi:hypothetical protein